MKLIMQWVLAATIVFGGATVVTACSNDHDDVRPLTEWQAGQTVSSDDVEAFGGIDKCFAAEPIPDGVWARMQGKTYKENPYIGRDDLRHIRALHWDYDNQMHIGDKWEVYIPAEMGYGKFSQPGIPGGSTLIFEIELLGIA